MRLEEHIRDIPDFPKPGIVFKDITPLFLDHEALRVHDRRARGLRALALGRLRGLGRGARLRAGRAPWLRRPARASSRAQARQAAARDRVGRVRARVRDRRARGARRRDPAAGRASWCTTTCWRPAARRGALCDLVEQAGGVVAGCAFVVELAFLNGRERLEDYDVQVARRLRLRVIVRRERTVCGRAGRRLGARVATHTTAAALVAEVSRVEEAIAGRLDQGAALAARARRCGPTTRAWRPSRPGGIVWRQEVEESPFERILSASTTEIALEPRRRRHARADRRSTSSCAAGPLRPVPDARGRDARR